MLKEVLARIRGSKRVLLDTNLLLAVLVGRLDRSRIGQKRVKEFRAEELDLLEALLAKAPALVTTTGILTEVSNLLGHLGAKHAEDGRRLLAAWIAGVDEAHRESRHVVAAPTFLRLGLTDAAIIEAATPTDLVMTADLALYLELERLGRRVVNFNHIRMLV